MYANPVMASFLFCDESFEVGVVVTNLVNISRDNAVIHNDSTLNSHQ